MTRERRMEAAIKRSIGRLYPYRGSIKGVNEVVSDLEESLIKPKIIKIPVTEKNVKELNENFYLNPPAIVGQIVEVNIL